MNCFTPFTSVYFTMMLLVERTMFFIVFACATFALRHLGAEEHSLCMVAQVVKCTYSDEDVTMSKCLRKVLEFYRCPLEHLLDSLSFYFALHVSRNTLE